MKMVKWNPLSLAQMNHPLLHKALQVMQEHIQGEIRRYKVRHPQTLAALNGRLFRQRRIPIQEV